MDRSRYLHVILLGLLHCSARTDAIDQGFFMISNLPEVDRDAEFYIYAIHTSGADADGEIEISKKHYLPPDVSSGPLPDDFGCYLKVSPANEYPGSRYGQYMGTFTPSSGASDLTAYTFVKRPSNILDTEGMYTVTIYPEDTDTQCLPDPVYIGVKWRPGCRKIVWCKGKRRNINQGPRLKLTSTKDAGLYTVFRPTRGKKGWFVQILVIAASCPDGSYQSPSEGCKSDFGPCLNGGVLRDDGGNCICPPFFVGETCACVVDTELIYMLGLAGANELFCSDLPGGDPTCKGHLVCYGDNYGCKCSSGWYGNACDRECPKGMYGANCEQTCPDSESNCNRFFGPMTNIQGNGCTPYVM